MQLVGAAVACMVTAPIAAQDSPFRFEITPYAAYRIGGELEPQAEPNGINAGENQDFELREGYAHGLMLDIGTGAGATQWEVLYAHQDTALETHPSFVREPTLDIDVTYLQFGGTYIFQDNEESIAPFIALTAGLTRFEPGLDDMDAENYFSWSLGGGVQLRADRRVGVRLEARVFGSLIDDNSALFCVSSAEQSACALFIEGKQLYQLEARVGVVARF